jgi:predicted esterase
MGHSMGGGGTLHLGIKHPELWAGLAPISPAIFRKPDDLEKIKHVPVIMIQGDKDPLVRVERVRPWAEKMKELKMTHEYVEVAGGDHMNIIKDVPKIYEFFNKHKKTAKK